MIRTSNQLKALVRNRSRGDSAKAQTIIRHYAMERFLERLTKSDYKDSIILKGGVLISSIIGLDNRSTMDVDATLRSHSLTEEKSAQIVKDIISIHLDDGMSFEISSVEIIMDEADYPGVRVKLIAHLEKTSTPFKVDFSSGDIITPREISYSYKLLFEEREIFLLAYNVETILAEKLEAIISRATGNTRMRDFYDVYAFESILLHDIDFAILKEALYNTSTKRGAEKLLSDVTLILDEVEKSVAMKELWGKYQKKYTYAHDVSWNSVLQAVNKIYMKTTHGNAK